MQEKIDWLRQYYLKNNLPLQTFNLIGIRDEANMSKDVINDKLGFFTDWELFLAEGTTDPGVYWTVSDERNPAGTFHLLSGFHEKIWTFGKHKGYSALVNDYRHCKPTRGWRDANYNYIYDKGDRLVCDYYGINFHRMHQTILQKLIGKYSGGCQVVRNIKDFEHIYTKALTSGVVVFNYMMFKAEEVKGVLI